MSRSVSIDLERAVGVPDDALVVVAHLAVVVVVGIDFRTFRGLLNGFEQAVGVADDALAVVAHPAGVVVVGIGVPGLVPVNFESRFTFRTLVDVFSREIFRFDA